jgi:hypothetical protein
MKLGFDRMSDVTDQYVARTKRDAEQQYVSIFDLPSCIVLDSSHVMGWSISRVLDAFQSITSCVIFRYSKPSFSSGISFQIVWRHFSPEIHNLSLRAKWHVRVSKQSCKQGNRLILWGVWAPRHFFFDFFSIFFFSKKLETTWFKCLHIHLHLDLKSLSFSTESTNVMLPTPWSFLTAAPRVWFRTKPNPRSRTCSCGTSARRYIAKHGRWNGSVL